MVSYIRSNPTGYVGEVTGYLSRKKEIIDRQEALRAELSGKTRKSTELCAEEYAKLPTQGHKVMYYYEHIYALLESHLRKDIYSIDTGDLSEVAIRIAYLLFNSVEPAGDELEYSKFPDILDDKNPIIHAVNNDVIKLFSDNNMTQEENEAALLNEVGMILLAAFLGKGSADELKEKESPFDYLTCISNDKEVSASYRIQRDIIALFCSEKPGYEESWHPYTIKVDA